jgi:hypothetical protein
MIAKVPRHNYLLSQMVPAMHMVATSRFRYLTPLVSWTDAELHKLHPKWLQVHLAAWRLPPSFPSALLMFPSADGGFPVAHPVVPMVQALAKHVGSWWRCLTSFARPASTSLGNSVRAVAAITSASSLHIWRRKGDFTSGGGKEGVPTAAHCSVFSEQQPTGASFRMEVKLPAYLSLGVAGRDTSWHALLMHLRQKAAHMEANQ